MAGCSSSDSSDPADSDSNSGEVNPPIENPVNQTGGTLDPDGNPVEETDSITSQETDPDPSIDPAIDPIAGINPETVTSCTAIDVINLGTGSQKITVPLDAGERLQLTNTPRGTLISVDESLGELHYVPAQGRAPDTVSYNVVAPDDTVVSQGQITLRLDPIRIMPLGDSITHGVEVGTGNLDSPPVPLRVGYRQALLEQLAGAGQSVDFTGQGGQRAGGDAGISDTDNNGYPGVDISFINDRVQEVFDELPSDVVLLHIGTNLTPDNAAGIDAILDNIDAWEAANHPVTVFVATIIPKRDPTLQQTVDLFNADLRMRVAARISDEVVLVEQANAVSVADIDAADVGVHPTAPGYLRMADTWFDALAASDLFPSCE